MQRMPMFSFLVIKPTKAKAHPVQGVSNGLYNMEWRREALSMLEQRKVNKKIERLE